VLIVDGAGRRAAPRGATGRLIEKLGASVSGYAFLLELGAMKGRERLSSDNVFSLICYS
jgi:adenine phosphoribosyltransferase